MEIPDYILTILKKLEAQNFEAFIVGGCVRDIFLGQTPKDWDIATNARPEQMLAIFPDGKYENNFGTVILPLKNEQAELLTVVEITTYRSEQGYSDRRHPDEVRFEDSLEKDLMRRDFTVNAMALSQSSIFNYESSIKKYISEIDIGGQKWYLADLFGGRDDVKKKILRAVGEPADRFREDALRMMRAVRFSSQLGFLLEPKTERAIVKLAGAIKFIANERIRDELAKILASDRPYEGIILLQKTKLLGYILPELTAGVGQAQNKHHIYTIFDHSVLTLKHCPSSDWQVRLAGLLHDVGKPKTKKLINGEATFYNHELVGARLARRIMDRLHFSRTDTERVVNLVKNHMFYYNVGEVTESSVRRLIAKVGEENLQDLIDLRIADRLGSGVPKAKPYKLRHLEYMFEKVRKDPVSVKMLKLNGEDVMSLLAIPPGPKIGAILDVLLSEVIDDPARNDQDFLKKRTLELGQLDLAELRKQAKEVIEEKKESDNKNIKKKYYV